MWKSTILLKNVTLYQYLEAWKGIVDWNILVAFLVAFSFHIYIRVSNTVCWYSKSIHNIRTAYNQLVLFQKKFSTPNVDILHGYDTFDTKAALIEKEKFLIFRVFLQMEWILPSKL